jgi:hypothetical protein
MRGGVPVFSRRRRSGSSRRRSARRLLAHRRRGCRHSWPSDEFAGQDRGRRQNHGRGFQAESHLGDHAGHAIAVQGQIVDRLLENRKAGLRFQVAPDRGLVQRAIRLAAGRAHCRTFRRVQRAPLDAGAIGCAGHDAAQRVDLLDQMAFADAADRRVATHLAERFDVVRQQQRARAEACGREGCFRAGVTATNDNDIVALHSLLPG